MFGNVQIKGIIKDVQNVKVVHQCWQKVLLDNDTHPTLLAYVYLYNHK